VVLSSKAATPILLNPAQCSIWRSQINWTVPSWTTMALHVVDFPATGFISVVLGILHDSKTQGKPVVQNPENH
jgi:hypothetical protein